MVGVAGVGGIALAYATVAVSPGTNFMIVSRIGLTGRRGPACLAAVGVATGVALVAGTTLVGSRFVASLPVVLAGLQIVFAIVLVTLGTSALRRVNRIPGPAPRGTAATIRRPFLVGLVTAISNPVTVGFFVGLATDHPFSTEARQVVAASCAVFTVAALWFCPVALLFSHPRLRLTVERLRSALDAVAGCLLIGLGVAAGLRSFF